jgi:hypothetical protein
LSGEGPVAQWLPPQLHLVHPLHLQGQHLLLLVLLPHAWTRPLQL